MLQEQSSHCSPSYPAALQAKASSAILTPTTSTQGLTPGQSSFQPFALRCCPWGNLLLCLLLLSGAGPDAASSPGYGRDIPTVRLTVSQTESMDRGRCCPYSPLHRPRADLNLLELRDWEGRRGEGKAVPRDGVRGTGDAMEEGKMRGGGLGRKAAG